MVHFRWIAFLQLRYNALQNLEIKRLTDEKKEAMAAQLAAEAALRRVHACQKDEEYLPVEAVIAPLESDIKKYKNEV